MTITNLWSGLLVGIVIGALGRLLVRGRHSAQIGCLLTVLIGVVGAAIGTAIGNAADAGDVVTFVIQVVAAALLVTLFGAASRR